jgi:hypothetical protein
MNSIIDLDTCLEPIDHDFDNLNWSTGLLLSRRDEAELLQFNAWLTLKEQRVFWLKTASK